MKSLGIYVHIPFCVRKCKYCDFVSCTATSQTIEAYVQAVIQEIQEVGETQKKAVQEGIEEPIEISTIYLGGGTPSLLEAEQIEKIMQALFTAFQIAKDAEITIEVNPGTITKEKLQGYRKAGIGRISIGVQSLQPHVLQILGRIHTAEEAKKAYIEARKAGFMNCNVDIMIGLPEQTLQDVQNTLQEILYWQPEHISVYSLIVEEGTPLEKEIQQGVYTLPEEELEREMYATVKRRLEEEGYIHYEISNFAKPGKESRHNLDCWNQKEYIGFGAAAHSYTNGVRYSNTEQIDDYIQNCIQGKSIDNFVFQEKQHQEDMEKEYMLLGFRKLAGISIKAFQEKFGEDPCERFNKELHTCYQNGLLEIQKDTIRLTRKGLDFANQVFIEFV